jgi:SAM-dependent methyltransferase
MEWLGRLLRLSATPATARALLDFAATNRRASHPRRDQRADAGAAPPGRPVGRSGQRPVPRRAHPERPLPGTGRYRPLALVRRRRQRAAARGRVPRPADPDAGGFSRSRRNADARRRPSPGFIDRARRRAPAVRFEVADGRRLPFDDATFDGAVFATTLCHVPSPELALAEAHRVLRRGGYLLVYDGEYVTTTVATAHYDPLLKAEARQRAAEGRFFGPIAYASALAIRPD